MAEPPKFARVLSIEPLTASVRQILVEMIEPASLDYRAGQTIVLYAGFMNGKDLKRQYTLASAPHEHEGKKLLLCVKLIPNGPASAYLERLQVGDQITLSGPVGKCVLPESHDGDFLWCATGNGIAPIRGMLLSYLHAPPRHTAAPGLLSRLFGDKGPKLRLLWGVRHEDDLFWRDQLDAIAARHKSFRYEIFLSQGGPAWAGKRGRLLDEAVAQAKALQHPKIFLIGNGAMIKALRARLEEEAKIPRDDVIVEAFFNPRSKQ